jgi:hypothetical protein
MKNCILCSKELKFMNTPTFGSGKLSDGGEICTDCFKKVNNINPNIALKLKKHSLADIQNLLSESAIENDKKNQRLEEIKSEIQNLKLDNISTVFGRKEINELPQILAPTEHIDNIIQGTYNNGQGILVSTNRRLLFVDKGLVYGLKVEDFPLDKISSIQYETGLLLGKVKVHTSGNIATIDNVEKASARKFAEFVRDKLSQPKESQTQVAPQTDILGQLEKLAKLKENGILSEEEFAEQKKKLLEKL